MRSSSQRRSSLLVYKERRLIEPGVTGARLNALAQPALVYKNSCVVSTEWVAFFYPSWHTLTDLAKGKLRKQPPS